MWTSVKTWALNYVLPWQQLKQKSRWALAALAFTFVIACVALGMIVHTYVVSEDQASRPEVPVFWLPYHELVKLNDTYYAPVYVLNS